MEGFGRPEPAGRAVGLHLIDHDKTEDRQAGGHDLGRPIIRRDGQRAGQIDSVHETALIPAGRAGPRAWEADGLRPLRRSRFHLRNPWSRIGPRITRRP